MGAADFTDEMTASARSVDSGLSNYPVNMINGGSKNERQLGRGVSCFGDSETTGGRGRNALLKGLSSGDLVPLHCLRLAPAPPAPPAPDGRYFYTPSFPVTGHRYGRLHSLRLLGL